mmetsp:Transcript_17020/g.19485  ORF Transcript_17020/g.19485 Transcript_17020/m.19485 type:complete len:430 (+) Transcript_17020:277-1566(+)
MSTDNPNLTLTIRMSTAARFTIGSTTTTNITPSSTILQIKQIISQHETSGYCAVDRQRLIHKGRILSIDTQTLRQYGIIDSEQTLHLVKGSARPAPSPSTSTASTTNTNTTGTNATNNNNTPFNPMMMPNMMNNMMMNNNGNNSGNPMMPNMDQMQQQLMSNPEMMSNIMNSPMMQSLTSNPDFMRSMIQSNPQMQQLLESNPELRHIMEDPELMRRSMEMMRDPSAMQNAMRNQDLALSQIENIPGGFSALRRMYEDVQEPMMDALSSSRSGQQSDNGNGTNNANRNSSGDNSGAAGTAMPNPWASTSSSTTTTTIANSIPNDTPLSSTTNVIIFIIGLIPFLWATYEFWSRIAVGSSFGTGKDSIQIRPSESNKITTIGRDNDLNKSRGQQVLGDDALLVAYFLFAVAIGSVGIAVYSVVSSPSSTF